jgi:hypothetical protein
MPDFDFDAFNHDNPEGYEEQGENFATSRPTEFTSVINEEMTIQSGETTIVEIVETSIIDHVSNVNETEDEIVITEKKPLEARESVASAGDNLSGEEVDKW